MIRKFLPELLRKPLRNIYYNYFDGYGLKSYSQEGEDMILRRLFENKLKGFYVDVGAHHPIRFSNTYFFYKLGWNGINIEPNPEGLALLKSIRPRDINLQFGVSDVEGPLSYFMFAEPALNTFDRDLAQQYSLSSRLISNDRINMTSLESILDENLPNSVAIDFMSIDVEGHDLNVIKSNSWEKYRPTYVIIEALGKNIVEMLEGDIARFMHRVSYVPYAKTVSSIFFKNCLSLI